MFFAIISFGEACPIVRSDNGSLIKGVLLCLWLMAIFLAVPKAVFAMPPVRHALDAEKSTWRNHYRDTFLTSLHKYTALNALDGYKTENKDIKEAIKLRMDGKGKDSLATLKSLTVKKGVQPSAELLFLTGLINESMGFFPEAAANYAMVETAPNGKEFSNRTALRRSFVKFIEAVTANSLFAMIDADGGFFRIYNESTTEDEWNEALAGHALVLYNFGDHKHAETIFASISPAYLMGPAYQFARAENYVSLGLHLNAIDLFERLKVYLVENEEMTLASYISLRLGDLYLMSGNDADATSNYNQILVDRNKDTPLAVDDGFIMQSMALAEHHYKKDEHVEATETLRRLLAEKLPPMLEIEKTGGLYLIELFRKMGFEEDAFLEAKGFLQNYPDTRWSPEVRAFVDDVIRKRINEAYASNDFQKVLYHYHVSLDFVSDPKLLAIVGTAFVERKLPAEAKAVFTKLAEAMPPAEARFINIGLARSEIMLGNADAGYALLSAIKPAGPPMKPDEERYFAAGLRELGDFHFKKAAYQASLWGYESAARFVKDFELDLRLAMALDFAGRQSDALKIYTALIASVADASVKGRAHIGRGDILFARKKWADALAYYKLGEASRAFGNEAEAIKAWKAAAAAAGAGGEAVYARLAEERLKEVGAWERVRM
jgi:tetratricopeptide (TPR) repeat protein